MSHSDAECPFCGTDLRPDRLEIYGDEESIETECPGCDRTVVVTASVHVTYSALCRESEHTWVPVPAHPGYEQCSQCDGPFRHAERQF